MSSFYNRSLDAAPNIRFRRFARSSAAYAVLGCLLTATSLTHAADDAVAAGAVQGSQEVTQLNEAGMELYKQRDYRRAVEKFLQAYAIDHDPNLLFNIARCYEQLGDSEAAIEKYEEFVKMPGADTQGRQRAYDSINQLRQLVAAAESGPQPAPNSTEASAPAAEQNSAPAPESPPATVEVSGDGPGLLPWFLLGAGVVAAGAGTTIYMLGQADHDQVREAPNYGQPGRVVGMTEAEARNWVETGDQKKLFGLIGVGVGGALMVTSAALFAFGGSSQEHVSEPQLALLPTTDGAGVVAFGRF